MVRDGTESRLLAYTHYILRNRLVVSLIIHLVLSYIMANLVDGHDLSAVLGLAPVSDYLISNAFRSPRVTKRQLPLHQTQDSG